MNDKVKAQVREHIKLSHIAFYRADGKRVSFSDKPVLPKLFWGVIQDGYPGSRCC